MYLIIWVKPKTVFYNNNDLIKKNPAKAGFFNDEFN